MSTKTKSIIVISARVVLGLIYFVFGLNFFFQFLPAQPQPDGAAGAYIGGLFQAGYFFPLLKGIEVIAGVLLLAGIFVPLTLVVIAPISLQILLFHILLAPAGAAMGIVLVALNLYLAWAYRDSYKPLFQRKANLSL
jgi:putative oxidoreductase